MKVIDLNEVMEFSADMPHRKLLYESRNLRVLAFNFEPGQEMPTHANPADADVTFMILEGEGSFSGTHTTPAKAGMLQIMPGCEAHGLRAHTRMRVLVFTSPCQ